MHANDANADQQRKRVRRSAILLGAVALSFYVAFIVMSVMRS
ncbi:MAG: hypothetical protein WDO72_10830 [Pseudomonadota bacterium]